MRDRNKLLPQLLSKLIELELLAKGKGIRFIVTQTLRSEEEQTAFYAQGRDPVNEVNKLRSLANLSPITDKENKVITKAKTVWDSFHAYGRAFDVAILNKDGKVDWSEEADWNNSGLSDWVELGKIGESIGLEWGGNFSSLRDLPHFQLREGKTILDLKKESGIVC